MSRLCLVYGGFKFEDERLSREDWLKQKDGAWCSCMTRALSLSPPWLALTHIHLDQQRRPTTVYPCSRSVEPS